MYWAAAAGLAAGFILGLLGAGGTVVGLPFFLYLALVSPHTSLGSNALGVFMIATVLYLYRLRRGESLVAPGVAYAVPGMAGILIGAQMGLGYPGAGLVFLLGFVLFAVAGWLLYLSRKVGRTLGAGANGGTGALSPGRIVRIVPVALAVGAAAGFFGIGGGFMIVPTMSLSAGIEISQAISASLLPIAGFAALVGLTYLRAGDVNLLLSAVMLPAGVLGGYAGVQLGRRIERRVMYVIFAAFLLLLGIYIVTAG